MPKRINEINFFNNTHHIKSPSCATPFHNQIIIPSLNTSNYFINNNISDFQNFPINNNNYNLINNNINSNIIYSNKNQINYNYNNNYNNNFLINNNYNSSRNFDGVKVISKNFVSNPNYKLNRNFSQKNNIGIVNNNYNSTYQNHKFKEKINLNYNNNIINLKLNSQENEKINTLKKNSIEKNGRKIGNIDINSDYQENDLNYVEQMILPKKDEDISFDLFKNNLISSKKKNENIIMNNINISNNFQSTDKTKNFKNGGRIKIKDRTQANLKYSNSVKNTNILNKKIDNNISSRASGISINNINNKDNNLNNFTQRINPNQRKKISCKIPLNNIKLDNYHEKEKIIINDFNNETADIIKSPKIFENKENYNNNDLSNTYYNSPIIKKRKNILGNMDNNINNENIDNNQIDENLENKVNIIENYQSQNHINSIENNYDNETPKGNTGNKMIFNPFQILKENSKYNVKTENIEKIKDKSPKDRKPKNNYKRIKAKSNNINFNLNEISKNEDKEQKYNNITNDLCIKFERNKNFININKEIINNNPIFITERKSNNNNKSHSKLKNNSKKKADVKTKIIQIKESLNRSENISPSDLENEDDGSLKINNFNDILKNKNKTKTLNTLENSNNNEINTIIDKSIEKYNHEKLITDINCSKNETNRNNLTKIEENDNILPPKINHYFKKYSADSLAGKDSFKKRKINQDLYLVKINMNNIEGFNAFGVLDGHGEYGHKISSFTRDFIIKEINNNLQKKGANSLSEIYSELIKDDYFIIKKAYGNVDQELPKQKFNSDFSGTTCIIVFQIGNNLITANVGDSRAILIYSDDPKDENLEDSKIFKLSIDQKPELPKEKKRIINMGGIVDQMLDKNKKRIGPYRVWAGKENYPGLSMSRSIGDLKGKKCGLISEPEIIEYKLNEKSKYMVICSDGVWEFLKNEDVMNIGRTYYINNNVDGFIKELIKVSEYWWEKEDIIRDDITTVIVFF